MNEKIDIRTELKQRRASIPDDERSRAAEAIAQTFLKQIELKPAGCVALYAPIGSELDTGRLSLALSAAGHPLALPVVVGRAEPLIFRSYHPTDTLELGPFGILQPREKAVEVIPDLICTPLLAFNRDRYRLGYGGGFYDRTLAHLRDRSDISMPSCIGVAFARQEADFPVEAHDQPLDAVVTENGVI